MGVSDGFPRRSHGRSVVVTQHGAEVGVFMDEALCAEIAPLLDVVIRRGGGTASPALLLLVQQTERFRATPSSSSTPPLPQPDAGERERIGAVEAAKRLGISRARFGQRCRRGDFDTARQDDSRGWWSIEVAEVDAVAGRGRTGSCMSPSDPGRGGAS